MEDKMEKSKYTTQQYKFISKILWGGVPVDRQWAENTILFKAEADSVLDEYPMLDKSFMQKEKFYHRNDYLINE